MDVPKTVTAPVRVMIAVLVSVLVSVAVTVYGAASVRGGWRRRLGRGVWELEFKSWGFGVCGFRV